ncbi:MAG: hypothetical protein ACLTYW_02570 [Collinsella sp.]
MVKTEIDNVNFKVPTVIPFIAKADGTLQGPQKMQPPSTTFRPTASMSPT